MERPRPTRAFHFTHVDNLRAIARDGLVCDAAAHIPGRLSTEVGDVGIKERRRRCTVGAGPGGVVADYVPFYFTPRGLMMLKIHSSQVPNYMGGQRELVYLCTTLERVEQLGLAWVASDRNAAKAVASFTSDLATLEHHVDWALATTSTFNRTPADPERPERHQAELLVHQRLPWEAVMFIGAHNADILNRVHAALGTLSEHRPGSDVRPGWYF